MSYTDVFSFLKKFILILIIWIYSNIMKRGVTLCKKKLRQYLYADVNMINSFFNQFYPDVKSLDISKSKDSHTNLDVGVELPSILKGFLKGNFSGEYGRDRGYSTSIQVEIPLEEK